MHDIEYYDDSWDSNCFFVCIDRYYIFAADRKSKSPKWEFIDPRGIRWDAVHQRIYRNGRADKVSKKVLAGEYLGMIKFGSRVDLEFEGDISQIKIKKGQKINIGDIIYS